MQCDRCKSVVADTCVVCPVCGNTLGVDSYGKTSFAPVMPAPQPARVSVSPHEDIGRSATLLSSQQTSPPTMASVSPPGPRAVITPAPQAAVQALGAAPTAYIQVVPPAYGPPPPYPQAAPLAPYPILSPQPLAPPGSTPGISIASLVCGLLGWVPLWIGFAMCVLAITFGVITLTQTKPGQNGRGLATAGLALGLALLVPAACGL